MKAMKLKQKPLVLACALACGAGLAAPAFADINLFIGGATALDTSLEKAVIDICDGSSGTRVKYTTAGAGVAWTCQLASVAEVTDAGLTPGEVVVIRKNTATGSASGIGPVNSSTPIAHPMTCAVTSTVTSSIFGKVFTLQTCSAGATVAPDAGISDVEPARFGTFSNLSAAGIVAQIFGVPVSNNIYRRLQVEQGLFASVAAANAGDPSFTEANAPTLFSSQLRGLYSGNVTDWAGIDADITASSTSGSTAVKICRRASSSGTQKTFDTRLLSIGCKGNNTGGSLTFADNNGDDAAGNNGAETGTAAQLRTFTGVFTAVMNSGSGQVDQCLTEANNQNEFAIGLLGTERLSGAPGTQGPSSNGDDADGLADGWHYVKVDGAYPSVANTINGKYDILWAAATFNRRISPAYPDADQPLLMDALTAVMGNPANITSIPLLGLAGLPASGYVWDGTTPVVKGERLTPAGVPNTCQDTLNIF